MPFIQSLHFIKVFQDVQGRFCTDSNSEKSDPKFPSGRPSLAFGCPSVSKRFSVLQRTSVQMPWQHVQTHIRVQEELGFPSQTRIWKDSCIRPDDRATPSEPDPYYESYVQQSCNHPDDRATQSRCSLNMENAWSALWKADCIKDRPNAQCFRPDVA